MAGSSLGSGGENDTATRSTSSLRRVASNTKAWMKTGAKKSRHKHLETIMAAAKGVVTWLAVIIVSGILFSTQPQGITRAVLNFVVWQCVGLVALTIIRYYRTAIIAGAMKKKSHDTARGTPESSGEVSNSSVVPSAASDVGEALHEAIMHRVASVKDRRDRGGQ